MVMKKIVYSGNIPYIVVREISTESCNPKKYGIDRTDKSSHMKILGLWVEHSHCDHVLLKDGKYLLCRTIKDAEIIE
jgi:hypothetical protein|tara:strand:- start:276 stop:506 length:231 start_codon:yes stop_codon:yes gene_type:complete